jgi:hypothetical protein
MTSKPAAKLPLFIAALFLASTCSADVVFTNIGSQLYSSSVFVTGTESALELHPYIGTASSPGQFFQLGSGLTNPLPGTNYALTSVTVGVTYDPQAGQVQPGNYSPDFEIWLYSNRAVVVNPSTTEDYPDAPIAEIGQSELAPSAAGLVTALAQPGITLDSGGAYWIILTADNPYTIATWDYVGPYFDQALEIDGSPLPTPEPATITLFALALIGLPLLRKRE